MPHLKVDRYGRFYETSPDRADGSGYKGHAPRVASTKDVYYGSPYLKFAKENKAETLRNRARLGREDGAARQASYAKKLAAVENARRAEIKQQLMRNPKMQKDLMKRAIMGCCPEYTKLNRTHGPVSDAVNFVATGKGKDTTIGISNSERMSMMHKERAQQVFATRAKAEAEGRRTAEQAAQTIKALVQAKEKSFGRRHQSTPISQLLKPVRRRPIMKPVEALVLHPMQLKIRG